MPKDLKTLRFPLVFGGILLLFYTGFQNRKFFMTDMTERKKEMDAAEDLGSKALIRGSIGGINRERMNKSE